MGLLQSTLDVLNQGYVFAAAHSNHQLVWLMTVHEEGLYVRISAEIRYLCMITIMYTDMKCERYTLACV